MYPQEVSPIAHGTLALGSDDLSPCSTPWPVSPQFSPLWFEVQHCLPGKIFLGFRGRAGWSCGVRTHLCFPLRVAYRSFSFPLGWLRVWGSSLCVPLRLLSVSPAALHVVYQSIQSLSKSPSSFPDFLDEEVTCRPAGF